jgi:hypothetical protein
MLLPAAASDHNPSIWASHIARIKSMYYHFQLIDWDRVLLTFCPVWPQTAILLIFASGVAGISDVSHHAWLWNILAKHWTWIWSRLPRPSSLQQVQGAVEHMKAHQRGELSKVEAVKTWEVTQSLWQMHSRTRERWHKNLYFKRHRTYETIRCIWMLAMLWGDLKKLL